MNELFQKCELLLNFTYKCTHTMLESTFQTTVRGNTHRKYELSHTCVHNLRASCNYLVNQLLLCHYRSLPWLIDQEYDIKGAQKGGNQLLSFNLIIKTCFLFLQSSLFLCLYLQETKTLFFVNNGAYCQLWEIVIEQGPAGGIVEEN
jgi:hypothetical protein